MHLKKKTVCSAAETFVADEFVKALTAFGVKYAFGVSGGAIAPLWNALAKSSIKVLHFRHEAGAAFSATELSIATGDPVVVFSTTGPGITNSITGLLTARWEGAKVIFLSPATPVNQHGRWAFQETSPYTLPIQGLLGSGPLFHYGTSITSAEEIPEVLRRLDLGLSDSGGFIAHVNIPAAVQTSIIQPLSSARISKTKSMSSVDAIKKCVTLLSHERFIIWVGFGARGAAELVRDFAQKTGAPVMCSPRGKGIFPEDHPQFLGVTGFGGAESLVDDVKRYAPSRILVLGSRLGEFTSFWHDDLIPSKGFIHVDIDATVPGVAYPSVSTLGIQADIREFVDELIKHMPFESAEKYELQITSLQNDMRVAPLDGSVRHAVLMKAIQKIVVEKHNALVITEAGNSFAWGSRGLHFKEPRYRVSSGFGSMGHATTGVLGLALANQGKAVAIVGDGAMLMNNEMSTAVKYKIPALWIILNDAGYRMVDHGMRGYGYNDADCDIPRADFVMISRGMGGDGIAVRTEDELEAALEMAMNSTTPFILDISTDPTCPPPFGGRMRTLVSPEQTLSDLA